MLVAALPSGPFFLELRQHELLRDFVSGSPRHNIPKLLALVGPIKSGKSAILMDVLPGMLVAQYAAAGGPTPVVFRFSFVLGDPPEAASLRLLQVAAKFAETQGFMLKVPGSSFDALNLLGDVIGDLASGIASRGGELCLLLDEVQVRI